ncbi:MAG: arsenate reductase (glutaredoxin) [Gammaproteobacteria bacterium]
MNASITLYHNPRCSKSRAALALLRERGIEPTIVEYLKTPPDEAALHGLLKKLGLDACDVIRKGEAPYRELGLGRGSITEVELIAAIAAHPILLERPIAVVGKRAVVGRPPERVLELL